MVVTELGILMDVNALQPLNALFAIDVIEPPNVTDLIWAYGVTVLNMPTA